MRHLIRFFSIIIILVGFMFPILSEEITPNRLISEDFCTQFNRVKQDMRNDFNNVKGSYQFRDSNGIDVYKCNVLISDALFAEVIHDSQYEFWACVYSFYSGKSKSEAQTVYNRIKAQIKECQISGWLLDTNSDLESGLIEESVYSQIDGNGMYMIAVVLSEYESVYMVELDFSY